MKLTLHNVTVDKIEVSNSKKNAGGSFAKMKLSGTMTEGVREALGIGDVDAEWPPSGESAGKLVGSFNSTSVLLTMDQRDLLVQMSEADIPISLADSFKWKLEDPDDETNRTVVYSFWARSADLASVQLMVAYKFAVLGGSSTAVLNYNPPNDGTPVNLTVDPNQLTLADQAREAVRDMPEGEGSRPTHAEKVRERKAESERKAAARKGPTVVN